MTINLNEKDLEQLVLMSDKVLVKPKYPQEKTQSGLFLPPSVIKDNNVSLGYVIKKGPGYAVPASGEYDEPWKKSDKVKYLPLETQPGDLAVYMQAGSIEIKFNSETYFIIPASAILMCVRDEGLFK